MGRCERKDGRGRFLLALVLVSVLLAAAGCGKSGTNEKGGRTSKGADQQRREAELLKYIPQGVQGFAKCDIAAFRSAKTWPTVSP